MSLAPAKLPAEGPDTMKVFFTTALLSLLVGSPLLAGESKAAPSSPEFQRMKALVGTWKGNTDMGQGPMEFTVEYRLISGGNALEERIFAGTPKEMVTMYYDRKGKLSMTHYCMIGNRPAMILKSSDAKKISLDFDPKCGVNKAEMHMHALTITFEDADTITQDWTMFQNGRAKDSHPFTLKRVKT